MLYHPLEVYCPHWRSAGQESTPRREFAGGLRVALEERAHTGNVNPSGSFRRGRAHAIFTGFFLLRFEFSCRELSKAVIIKRVPRRVAAGIHISARSGPAPSSCALLLSNSADLQKSRLGGAWFRWKASKWIKIQTSPYCT